MSESPPAAVAGAAPVNSQEALTPEAIEGVLADFRSWLQEAAGAGRGLPTPAADDGAAPIDLHTLLGQFIALRHEVNLQTRAVRAQQEQNAETLHQLTEALATLGKAQASVQQPGREPPEELLRPVLKSLIDVYDALSLASREAQRVQGSILSSLDQLPALLSSSPLPRHGAGRIGAGHRGLAFERLAGLTTALLARMSGAGAPAPENSSHTSDQPLVQETVEQARRLLESLLAGYTMSLRRVERTLQTYQLEPLPCVGQPFDPEMMEVVEAVPDSGRPAGEVLDEVRRGYRWRGRLFRPAQVRVAKK